MDSDKDNVGSVSKDEEESDVNWFEEMLKTKRKHVRTIWVPGLLK